MSDPFDDQLKAYLSHAESGLFQKIKASAVGLTIAGNPDPKICLELGAMILLDKPIIVCVPEGRTVSANLKRVASAIVYGNPADEKTGRQLNEALRSVMDNDTRSRQ